MCSAQWTPVEWAETDGISNINFVDDLNGYAKMSFLQGFTSSFEKTEDGGETWTELNIPVNPTDIQDMDFLVSGEGALSTRTYIDGEVATRIFKTLDDCDTWEDISPEDAATGYGMSQIQMLDANTIFFVIDDYFYRTTNGGVDWTSSLLTGACVSVNFSDADHGLVGTWDGTFIYTGGIMATADGGLTWNETFLEVGQSVIGAVKQLNETDAYAAPVKWGASGHLHYYITTDNGENWTTIPVPETGDEATLIEFDFRDENFGVVVLASNTQTYMYKTSNAGETWELQNQLDPIYISDLDLSPNSGYIAAESGQILRMDAASSVSEFATISVTLFPNPYESGQTITWNSSTRFTQLRILDSTGRLVHEQAIDSQEATLPILSSGVYVVSLQNELVSKSMRLVVE